MKECGQEGKVDADRHRSREEKEGDKKLREFL